MSRRALQRLGEAADDDPGEKVFSAHDTFADDGESSLMELEKST